MTSILKVNEINTSDNATSISIKHGGITAITIDSSQNVGIGTSSPSASYKLDVSGAIRGTALTVAGNIAGNHILPNANDTYDLGASGNVWRNLYTGDLHLSNEAKDEGNAVDGTKVTGQFKRVKMIYIS